MPSSRSLSPATTNTTSAHTISWLSTSTISSGASPMRRRVIWFAMVRMGSDMKKGRPAGRPMVRRTALGRGYSMRSFLAMIDKTSALAAASWASPMALALKSLVSWP